MALPPRGERASRESCGCRGSRARSGPWKGRRKPSAVSNLSRSTPKRSCSARKAASFAGRRHRGFEEGAGNNSDSSCRQWAVRTVLKYSRTRARQASAACRSAGWLPWGKAVPARFPNLAAGRASERARPPSASHQSRFPWPAPQARPASVSSARYLQASPRRSSVAATSRRGG